jgi:hypothetical protein
MGQLRETAGRRVCFLTCKLRELRLRVERRSELIKTAPKETPLFFEFFPYVCPEPVLVK